MKLYIIENPLVKLLEKVRFIRCYQIYIDICIFIFVRHLLLRKRYIVRHYNYVINTITLSSFIDQ